MSQFSDIRILLEKKINSSNSTNSIEETYFLCNLRGNISATNTSTDIYGSTLFDLSENKLDDIEAEVEYDLAEKIPYYYAFYVALDENDSIE